MRATSGTRRVSSRGLVYSRRGTGSPIVLLHGWCLSRGLWMYQEESLAGAHQVFAVDQAGFGESSDLDGPFDLQRYVLDLEAFLLEEVGGAAVVVGFAFGAAVGLSLAARRPDLISGLVSIGVPSAAHAPYDRMPRAMRRDWPDFAARSARAICKSEISPATLLWLGQMFGATPLPVALETVALLGRFEPAPVAIGVPVPTLFVHGADDDVVPLSVSRDCAAAMPAARVEIVDGSGHLVVIDKKERLNEILGAFASDPDAAVIARTAEHGV